MGRGAASASASTSAARDDPAAAASSTLQKLQFIEALTKVGSSSELLRRLNILHKELGALEQEAVDTSSLDKVSRELMGKNLLFNKDKGVRAFVACALADLLRLYAPDAPYTGAELKDIFDFFIDQLKNLTGPQCPNFHEYYYLVESLANVKSAVLICEVPDADKLITKTFKAFFDLAKHDIPKNVLVCMADILTQLLDEARSIPSSVIDLILVQFLPKNVRSSPTSTSLAVETCNATSDKLQRYVAQYFTETILHASPEDYEDASDDSEAGNTRGGRKGTGRASGKNDPPSIADSQDFITAHELIKSINRTCPSLLTNVIPQLQEELTAEDVGVRILSTKTLGDMFSDKPLEKNGSIVNMVLNNNGAGNGAVRSDLARKYPSTWIAWLGRAKDKSTIVRLTVIEAFKDIIGMHPELGKDVWQILHHKLTDPDEKIRSAACSCFSLVDYETCLHSFDKTLLHSLSERIKDKKAFVQREALQSLGRMYNNAFGEISNGTDVAIKRFAWIPQDILKAVAVPDRELIANAERVLQDFILPLPSSSSTEDEQQWVDRLLTVMQYLDVPHQKGLFRLARLQEKKPAVYLTYLDTVEAYNGGVMVEDKDSTTQRLKTVCRVLASSFPEPAKAEEHLLKFAKMNDNRLYKLLRVLMDTQSDLKTIIKTHAEALKRIEASSSSILETFTIFIRRSALLIINRSSIPHFFRKIQEAGNMDAAINGDTSMDEDEALLSRERSAKNASICRMLLDMIAKNRPELFIPHLLKLSKSLLEEQDEQLVEITLYALSQVVLVQPDAFERDHRVLERAYQLAINGTPTQAKYAATFVAKVPDNEDQAGELVQEIATALPAASGTRLVSYLTALKRLAKYAPSAYQNNGDEITPFVIASLKRSSLSSHSQNGDSSLNMDIDGHHQPEFADWCEDEDFLPEHQACILGLKILTNRCLAVVDSPNAPKTANQTIRVMTMLLEAHGSPANFKAGPGLAGRLRLQAAISLLRLATAPQYDKYVIQHLHLLAWAFQDQAFQVRGALIHKLVAYTLSRRITNPRYTTILFITAHDPDYENILMAQRSIVNRASKLSPEQRLKEYDMLIVRLIHMLAHHPDFQKETEDLKFFVKYIEFFLDCLGTKDNIAVLFLLAGKIKSIRDSESQGHSENLYVISELAQYVIRARAQLNGWSLDAPPIHIKMPGDIFKPLPSTDVEKDIRNQVYLSDEIVQGLGTVGKAVKLDSKKPKATKPAAEKKRKSSPKPQKEKKPSKAARLNGDDDIGSSGSKKPRSAAKRKDTWQEDSNEEEDTAGESSSDEDLQAYEDEMAAEAQKSAANKKKLTNGKAKGKAKADDTATEEEDEDDDTETVGKENGRARPANLQQKVTKPDAASARSRKTDNRASKPKTNDTPAGKGASSRKKAIAEDHPADDHDED